jgi:hypothetical protein
MGHSMNFARELENQRRTLTASLNPITDTPLVPDTPIADRVARLAKRPLVRIIT